MQYLSITEAIKNGFISIKEDDNFNFWIIDKNERNILCFDYDPICYDSKNDEDINQIIEIGFNYSLEIVNLSFHYAEKYEFDF